MKIKTAKINLLITTLCAAAIALPFASQTARADDASPAPAASPAKSSASHTSGTISAVDATAKTIAIEGKKASKTFEVPDSATITGADGSATTLADLKKGDHVHITYKKGDDGKPEVVTLKVSAASTK